MLDVVVVFVNPLFNKSVNVAAVAAVVNVCVEALPSLLYEGVYSTPVILVYSAFKFLSFGVLANSASKSFT